MPLSFSGGFLEQPPNIVHNICNNDDFILIKKVTLVECQHRNNPGGWGGHFDRPNLAATCQWSPLLYECRLGTLPFVPDVLYISG